MKFPELKEFLEEKVKKFNRPSFIETDPVQVPRQFIQKENIEISVFFAATLSWGNRAAIIKNALRLMKMMDNRPHEFIQQSSDSEHSFLTIHSDDHSGFSDEYKMLTRDFYLNF